MMQRAGATAQVNSYVLTSERCHSARGLKRLRRALLMLFAATVVGVGSLALVAPAQAMNYALAAQFGSEGSGDGQFNSPESVAVDLAGNVIVADSQNHRIQVFNSTGGFVDKWGGNGNGDSQFTVPQGVAFDALNNTVVVADTDNDRIQVFEPDGDFIRKWGTSGLGENQLARPEKVAVDSSGKVYVAERDNHRIHVFGSTGGHVTMWGSQGTGDGQFVGLHGVAVDPTTGNVLAADEHRIQVFSSTGTFIRKWGSVGTGDGQFSTPRGIAVDAAGNVFVASGGDRMQQFSSTGTFIRKWVSAGPRGVAIDAVGNVFVAEPGANRVGKYVLSPEVTVKKVLVPAADPGRFDLKVNGTTVKAAAGSGEQGSAGVLSGSTATVSEVAASGPGLAAYVTTIDCGAGPQAGTSLNLTNVTADTLCTITNRRRPTITVTEILVPPTDPGRFDLKVNDTTVKAGAGRTGQGSTTVAAGSNAVVSEVAATGTALTDYDTTIDCGAGAVAGTSINLSNVTADTTCTITNSPSGSAPVQAVTFSSTGAEQQFTVPAGVTSVFVAAVAGNGGDAGNPVNSGGRGAEVTGSVPVTPGQTLFVEVGGNGSTGTTSTFVSGGFNGGGASPRGSGGGASDVRTISRTNPDATASLDSRLITAGGGGGAGGAADAGAADHSGTGCSAFSVLAGGGGGGTAAEGGAGGAGSRPGQAGAYGEGGAAAVSIGVVGSEPGGGGGGGGWYGGGGGGEADYPLPGFPPTFIGCGAGGGGGSSHVASSVTSSSMAVAEPGSTPAVTIVYSVPGTPGTPGTPDTPGTPGTAGTPPTTTTPPSTTPGLTDPFHTLDASALILSCAKTRIVLVDVVPAGRRVQITGVATASVFNGKKLDVLLNGKKLGTVTVAAGAFNGLFKAPKAREIKRAAYQVRLGKDASKRVKLDRRVIVNQIAVRGGQVVISGRVTAPLARRPDKVVFRRQTSCTQYEPAGSATPNRSGRFTARLPLPPVPIRAAVYRGETRVAARAGARPTRRSFTLGRVIRIR